MPGETNLKEFWDVLPKPKSKLWTYQGQENNTFIKDYLLVSDSLELYLGTSESRFKKLTAVAKFLEVSQ